MRLHAYHERSEEACQDITKHSQPRFKKRLLVKDIWCHIPWWRLQKRWQFRTVPLGLLVVVVRYTSRSVLYKYSSIGSSSFRYNPNTRRRKGKHLFLRHLYHVLVPLKGGKMRLEVRLPQHGLIFHPCVPSKNAGLWGKSRCCKMAVETGSTVL